MRLIAVLASSLALASGINAQTVLLTKELIIKPIYINNGAGVTAILDDPSLAAKISIFQDATQKIFAQAGIRVVWESQAIYTDTGGTSYFSMDGNGGDPRIEMSSLTQDATHGHDHGQSLNANTLNLWFTGTQSSGAGLSEQSVNSGIFQTFKNGATVTQSLFAGNYLGSVAHEIGHNLGIDHVADANNLMYSFGVSTTIGNIYPDGLQNSQLTSVQIATMYLNPLLQNNPVANDYYTYSAVPEPHEYAMVSGLLIGLYALRKRRRSGR